MNLMNFEGELKVIKLYPYRQAEVRHRFIFPRKLFKEIEESLIKQVNDYRDNHVVFLVESDVMGYTERIALYFHDYAVMIGKEEDIVVIRKNSPVR